jgi:predicted PurR-regulated permease PerM
LKTVTKNIISYVIRFALVVIIVIGFGVIMVDSIIYDYNQTLPKQVDSVSIMTSIDRVGRTINVQYVLIQPKTADIIASMKENTAKKVMKESFCSRKILNYFNIQHTIKAPSGKIVYQQVLTKKECKN